jgi:hypothetical protein
VGKAGTDGMSFAFAPALAQWAEGGDETKNDPRKTKKNRRKTHVIQ